MEPTPIPVQIVQSFWGDITFFNVLTLVIALIPSAYLVWDHWRKIRVVLRVFGSGEAIAYVINKTGQSVFVHSGTVYVLGQEQAVVFLKPSKSEKFSAEVHPFSHQRLYARTENFKSILQSTNKKFIKARCVVLLDDETTIKSKWVKVYARHFVPLKFPGTPVEEKQATQRKVKSLKQL